MLYFRMLLTMGVSLYTVRAVLDTLGVVDYGIYNVVGGIVTMFSFLSGTMASASQRFFAFELGRKNYGQLKKTFSMTMTIYTMLAVLILVLAETAGLWFLNTKMSIPPERMNAAWWIYQFALLSFMITMFTTPYNASIIAHERMNVYAWVSIVEVILRLGIVYILSVFSFDKLKLYAVLMFAVTAVVAFIYQTYCRKKFEECRFSFYWNKPLFKEIVSYTGWNLFGNLSVVFNNQGVGVVLNMFFGPLVNAAQVIAIQVSTAIGQFVQNFMTAVRPQIIKYYAGGEKDSMMQLVFQSSKYSFLLHFILTMPILLETNFIFTIWLKEVPKYVVLFTRLIVVATLIDSLSYPLMTAAQATGKVKKYQSTVGGMLLLNLPGSYLFLKFGHFSPQIVFYVAIVNSVICLFLRLLLLRKMVSLSVRSFLYRVLLPLLSVIVVAYVVPFFLLQELDAGFLRFFIVALAGLLTSVISIYGIALSKNERKIVLQTVRNLKTKNILKR